MDSVLSRNIFRWVLATSAVASLIIAMASYAALERQTNQIANQEIKVASAQAVALSRYLPTRIAARTKFWATQNETLEYLKGTGPGLISNSLTAETLQSNGVEDIILLRADGQIAAEYLTGASAEERSDWLKVIKTEAIARTPIESRDVKSGFINIAGRLHVIAASPVIDPNGQGKVRGVMVMGREITAMELSNLLQMPTRIIPGNDQTTLQRGQTALVHLPLTTIAGTKSATLEFKVPLRQAKAGWLMQMVLPAALFTLTLLSSALVFFIFNRLVTRRITALNNDLRDLTTPHTVHRLPDDNYNDEIASLRAQINNLIDHIDAINAEERRLRKQALFALNDARRAEKAKSNFIAITSHEVRNPLAAVVGGIDVLLTHKLPPKIAPVIARLEKSATRLKEIVNDVLDLSRIDQGSVPLLEESFDLVALVANVVEASQTQAKAKGLALSFATEAGRALVVSDKFRIEQILTNLIDNALKFTESGEVSVELSLVGAGRWRFAVKDTGIGVSAAVSSKLFDPYFQADQSIVRRHGGTGLGLAICRRIVTAMQGRIWLESEPGRGSIFYVELPLKAPKGESPLNRTTKPKPEAPGALVKPLSILVVEDNDLVLAMMRDQILSLGHRVETATNGLAAFNAVATRNYDAILMDMHMPVMDGITATRSIRALDGERGDVPIIAITADAAPSRRSLYEGNNFYAFLTKPTEQVTLQKVLATIEPTNRKQASRKPLPEIVAPDRILQLEHKVGLSKLAKHIGGFAKDLSVAGDQLLSHCSNGNVSAAIAIATKLQGSALELGAVQLQDRLLAVQELEADSNVAEVISAFSATLRDTQLAVDGLLESVTGYNEPVA